MSKSLIYLVLICVGDYITGADTGGWYELSPNSAGTVYIDPSTGCFESDSLDCGMWEFYYIIEKTLIIACDSIDNEVVCDTTYCQPACYDTTVVTFMRCCLDDNPICN